MKLYNNNEEIVLETRPFASGGEGHLYRVIAPEKYTSKVAKIYYDSKDVSIRESKIRYLCEHPLEAENCAIAWPEDMVYEDGQFIGFIMSRVEGEKLEHFCLPKLSKKLQDTQWQRFDFQDPYSLQWRLRLCYNLAVAVHQIHESQRYIITDLKPDNILAQSNGVLYLVDMDSVGVVEDGQSVLGAPVATPEYTPPEYYRKANLNYDPTTRQSWDAFSMGIIFYKLLLGIHPYAATSGFPYDDLNSLEQKIEQGLFVQAPSKADFLKQIPDSHQLFDQLPKSVRSLFMRCFVDGHSIPEKRPLAEEWAQVLAQALEEVPAYVLIADSLYNKVDLPVINPFFEEVEDYDARPRRSFSVKPVERLPIISFSYMTAISILMCTLIVFCWAQGGSWVWVLLGGTFAYTLGPIVQLYRVERRQRALAADPRRIQEKQLVEWKSKVALHHDNIVHFLPSPKIQALKTELLEKYADMRRNIRQLESAYLDLASLYQDQKGGQSPEGIETLVAEEQELVRSTKAIVEHYQQTEKRLFREAMASLNTGARSIVRNSLERYKDLNKKITRRSMWGNSTS